MILPSEAGGEVLLISLISVIVLVVYLLRGKYNRSSLSPVRIGHLVTTKDNSRPSLMYGLPPLFSNYAPSCVDDIIWTPHDMLERAHLDLYRPKGQQIIPHIYAWITIKNLACYGDTVKPAEEFILVITSCFPQKTEFENYNYGMDVNYLLGYSKQFNKIYLIDGKPKINGSKISVPNWDKAYQEGIMLIGYSISKFSYHFGQLKELGLWKSVRR